MNNYRTYINFRNRSNIKISRNDDDIYTREMALKKKKENKLEEKNAPPDANKDKSKSSIIKDISKENESQKENPRTQSKIIDSKNTKSDKITNPIINKNNLNPGKDSSLSKIINENEKVSSYKRSKANSQYLPSEIKGDIAIEKEKSK